MDGYRNILFPINENEEALDFAIREAKSLNAKLYLLHTYRFDGGKGPEEKKNDYSLKRAMDERHWKTLQDKYSSKLDESGINYELVVEIGFLVDRILFNFREHKIDMVYLSEKNKSDEPVREKLQDLNIPLTIIS